MNIQEAKDSIKDAISAYLSKDDGGNYIIPTNRQRPMMLIGAPGLGKTAIMSQIASEMGIGYMAYTITHHTRQSAIGLPVIEKADYGGEQYNITRYTMSEIISSVYDEIERKGYREGILFIDEINCVSETLAPAMLDLLQNKKFGPHRIPPGWILVAAGNPPEYNSSAREFDIATLDRIRVIDVEPDAEVWMRYARSAGTHEAITYYLQIKPQNLLKIERTVNGPVFVTPRAWEDLSTIMKEYDRCGFRTDLGLISQYIRDPDMAAEFNRYLEFHRKYRREHDVESIMNGNAPSRMTSSDSEERLAVISVMIGRLNSEAESGMDQIRLLGVLEEALSKGMTLKDTLASLSRDLEGNITQDARRGTNYAISFLQSMKGALSDDAVSKQRTALDSMRNGFNEHLDNCMAYLLEDFGEGPEAMSLMVGLLGCYNVVMFSEPDDPLYRYNETLLSNGRNATKGVA